jgi:hypothetical protein
MSCSNMHTSLFLLLLFLFLLVTNTIFYNPSFSIFTIWPFHLISHFHRFIHMTFYITGHNLPFLILLLPESIFTNQTEMTLFRSSFLLLMTITHTYTRSDVLDAVKLKVSLSPEMLRCADLQSFTDALVERTASIFMI